MPDVDNRHFLSAITSNGRRLCVDSLISSGKMELTVDSTFLPSQSRLCANLRGSDVTKGGAGARHDGIKSLTRMLSLLHNSDIDLTV